MSNAKVIKKVKRLEQQQQKKEKLYLTFINLKCAGMWEKKTVQLYHQHQIGVRQW